MMPVRSRARDDVQGCTSVAGGMDAGSDRPVCGPLSKKPAKPTRLCHHWGSAFWVLFGAFQKGPRPSVRERI